MPITEQHLARLHIRVERHANEHIRTCKIILGRFSHINIQKLRTFFKYTSKWLKGFFSSHTKERFEGAGWKKKKKGGGDD